VESPKGTFSSFLQAVLVSPDGPPVFTFSFRGECVVALCLHSFFWLASFFSFHSDFSRWRFLHITHKLNTPWLTFGFYLPLFPLPPPPPQTGAYIPGVHGQLSLRHLTLWNGERHKPLSLPQCSLISTFFFFSISGDVVTTYFSITLPPTFFPTRSPVLLFPPPSSYKRPLSPRLLQGCRRFIP